ncbi:hypothetical protein SYNGFB01_08185 [Synechococcus sp. GFB01]|nr:hypothetical protein SYNGFB01_08185 [Synechococcus sp. GFB01]
MLVVVAILGVLGAVGYGAYIANLATARENSARVAVVAAAKSCAAILAGGGGTFVPAVNTNQIAFSATCALGQTFSAQANGSAVVANATINGDGAVIPQ